MNREFDNGSPNGVSKIQLGDWTETTVPLRWGYGGKIVGMAKVSDDGTVVMMIHDKTVLEGLASDLTEFSIGWRPATAPFGASIDVVPVTK